MLQIEIDTDAIAGPPEAFRAAREQQAEGSVPTQRINGESSSRQPEMAVSVAEQSVSNK